MYTIICSCIVRLLKARTVVCRNKTVLTLFSRFKLPLSRSVEEMPGLRSLSGMYLELLKTPLLLPVVLWSRTLGEDVVVVPSPGYGPLVVSSDWSALNLSSSNLRCTSPSLSLSRDRYGPVRPPLSGPVPRNIAHKTEAKRHAQAKMQPDGARRLLRMSDCVKVPLVRSLEEEKAQLTASLAISDNQRNLQWQHNNSAMPLGCWEWATALPLSTCAPRVKIPSSVNLFKAKVTVADGVSVTPCHAVHCKLLF